MEGDHEALAYLRDGGWLISLGGLRRSNVHHLRRASLFRHCAREVSRTYYNSCSMRRTTLRYVLINISPLL